MVYLLAVPVRGNSWIRDRRRRRKKGKQRG
jgi:hypothetical protein